MNKTLIVDLSHHQLSSKIDWKKAAKEVALCIIRVQYGARVMDREYRKHKANCKKVGIPFGLYAYALFHSVEDAKIEAKAFLERSDKDAKFLVVDVEEKTTPAVEEMGPATQAFIDVCRAVGWKTGLYTGHHVYKPFGMDKVKADFMWIPRYGSKQTKPNYHCELWQYTSTGKVDWYDGNLDLNMLNGDRNFEWFTEKEANSKDVGMTKKEVPKEVIHTVVKGDTLGKLAVRYHVTVEHLVKHNHIPNRDRIYPGQEILVSDPEIVFHKVVSGDTVSRLAVKYGSSQEQIQSWNKLDQRYMIKIGETIRVR